MTTRRGRRRASRAGLSVVEVLVAVVVFGIASSGLAAMTFWVGTRSTVAALATHRSNAMVEEGDRLAVLPFDSLSERSECHDRGDQSFAYVRCIRVEELSMDSRRLTLVLSPRQRSLRSDTLVLERVRGTPYNPLQ